MGDERETGRNPSQKTFNFDQGFCRGIEDQTASAAKRPTRVNTYFLKSEHLGFRIWTEDDLPLALQLWGDEKVTQFIDARGELTNEQVQDRLNKEIQTFKKYNAQYWPVFLLVDGFFIGCCGLRPYKPEERIFELGVHLCSGQWGHGYAAEAGLTVMKYAFDSLSAKALFAGHHPQNEASRHLLNKIGFRYTHDEFYVPTGLMHPSYVITSEEFIKSRLF